jgi:hypothetical protein
MSLNTLVCFCAILKKIKTIYYEEPSSVSFSIYALTLLYWLVHALFIQVTSQQLRKVLTFRYIEQAIGQSKTFKIFGLGGLRRDALVYEARQDLLQNRPLG